MKFCGHCKCEKSLDSFYKNGTAIWCISCEKEYKRAYYLKNKEKIKAKSRAWAEANPEHKAASDKAWREANVDRCNENRDKWREANWERVLEISRNSRERNIDDYRKRESEYRSTNRETCNQRISEWKKDNRDRVTYYSSKRRAKELAATPLWVDETKIVALYNESKHLTEKTGIPHHVDHIVPLISPLVSGLHWEGNLQVIPATENLKKNNRYWPDMPD